jgi:hypothetical protein
VRVRVYSFTGTPQAYYSDELREQSATFRVNTPTPSSVLYLVPSGLIPNVMQAAAATNGSSSVLDHEGALLVAALRSGHEVQAMTTLPNGNVLFALSASPTT